MSDPDKTPVILPAVGGAFSHAEPKVSVAHGVPGPIQSPTGLPVISPKATPYIAAGSVVLGILQHFIPAGTVVGQVLSWVVPLTGVLLGASPGLRLNSLTGNSSKGP